MCELFALSSRHPATVRFSLEEFSKHGGLSGPHKDGWGVVYYTEGDVRLVKEAQAAADSACMRFMRDTPFVTNLAISHIRHATFGGVAMRNCQPFQRELGGYPHVFAHNGDLKRESLESLIDSDSFQPVGETDSELAFCALLNRLRRIWKSRTLPGLQERSDYVKEFAKTLHLLGPANFLYSDGDALFAYSDRRTQTSGVIASPGLHLLHRHCAHESTPIVTSGLSVNSVDDDQDVVLIASVPLTSEPGWQALAEGKFTVVKNGRIVSQNEVAVSTV